MVIRLHRKMGENTERRKGMEAVAEKAKEKDHINSMDAFALIEPFAESEIGAKSMPLVFVQFGLVRY